MIQDTWKAIVSPGRIGEAPNRASHYPSRLSNSLPRNPRLRSPAPKRTRAATAALWRSPNSESLWMPIAGCICLLRDCNLLVFHSLNP